MAIAPIHTNVTTMDEVRQALERIRQELVVAETTANSWYPVVRDATWTTGMFNQQTNGSMSITLAIKELHAVPVVLPTAQTFSKMAIANYEIDASSLLYFAIYANEDCYPGALLYETAQTNCTTGDPEAAFSSPVELDAGIYWAAVFSDGNGATHDFGCSAGIGAAGTIPCNWTPYMTGSPPMPIVGIWKAMATFGLPSVQADPFPTVGGGATIDTSLARLPLQLYLESSVS